MSNQNPNQPDQDNKPKTAPGVTPATTPASAPDKAAPAPSVPGTPAK